MAETNLTKIEDSLAANKPIQELINSIDKSVEQASGVTVLTQSSVNEASQFISSFKKLDTRIEDIRKQTVKPLNDKVKAINTFFKELQGRFVGEDSRLKKELLSYNKKQHEIAEANRQREQEELEKSMIEDTELFGEQDEIPQVEFKTETIKQKNDFGTGTARVAKYKIIDESKIPNEYRVVDETKISKQCKSTGVEIIIEKAGGLYKEVEIIPGVVFYVEETILQRS